MKETIVTHSGDFHPDDVFAVATLLLALGATQDQYQIIRTREDDIIASADYVVDVGGEYDEARNRFDHHQIGGAGVRENGIPYASFGLVWKKYGEKICGSTTVARLFDERFVQGVDAMDNGVDVYKPLVSGVYPYRIENMLIAFRPTWKEDSDVDEIFTRLVTFVQPIILREIKTLQDTEEGNQIVEKIWSESKDKRIIVMEKEYPWGDVLGAHIEPLYVVYPSQDGKTWHAKAVRKDLDSFTNRKDFPAEWAGKRDLELAKITGVPDAVFCHNKRFIVVAKTKEGVLKLVEMAVNA